MQERFTKAHIRQLGHSIIKLPTNITKKYRGLDKVHGEVLAKVQMEMTRWGSA